MALGDVAVRVKQLIAEYVMFVTEQDGEGLMQIKLQTSESFVILQMLVVVILAAVHGDIKP